jgi:transposase InsO family protein
VPSGQPFAVPEIEALSATVSESTGQAYGVQRVCRVFDQPRSTFYCHRDEERTPAVDRPTPAKRGPKTALSDGELLEAIRRDLAASPFHGEGHRKVRARLKVLHDIHVANKRVLRLMRENHLLSPHRGRPGHSLEHDRQIVTDTPNEMWGTDGAKILTVDDGWVWFFGAVEHWNAECVGWHVIKAGTRYEALQPISMAVKAIFGSLGPDVARGLALRMDHGSQYLSDHFLNQIRYWGIRPSFAFVEQPETNGVIERAGHLRAGLQERRRGPCRRQPVRPDLQQTLATREARVPLTHRGSSLETSATCSMSNCVVQCCVQENGGGSASSGRRSSDSSRSFPCPNPGSSMPSESTLPGSNSYARELCRHSRSRGTV